MTAPFPRHPDLIKLGKAVRKLRKKKGLSQEELGFEAGLDRTYIGGIERGERNIGFLNLVQITEALGVSLQAFAAEFER